MHTADTLQMWVAGLDRRLYAVLVGAMVGLVGGAIGLLLAVAGPIITTGVVIGTLVALYALTDVRVALYGVFAITFLLPFGTLPVKVVLTPTLLDAAIGGFLFVYLCLWMTGQRQTIQLTPVHIFIFVYALWLVLSFALGLRYAPPTPNKLRQFVETLLSISLAFVLVDLLRDPATLRRLVFIVIGLAGAQAVIALGLYALPDALGERTLVRLARIGYPNGGVIRYIEDNPDLPERAIGTWVDPNALGGVLAISASMITPQIFGRRPVLRYRWLTVIVTGVIGLALLLTFSRASMLGFALGLVFMAVLRYRKLIPLMGLGLVVLLFLPQTQFYIERFVQAFTASDLATQMRIGEYTDSLRLIRRYPVFGVGFTGTPDIDIYTDVANMYLIMSNQIGLVGLGIFLVTMGAVFLYGLHAWRNGARQSALLESIHLGYHAALLTAMFNGAFDLYFFRLDFQGSITLYWTLVGLALASSRLVLLESSVDKTHHVG